MDKILSLIGIARKSGRIEAGEDAVITAARTKKARLILVASDASENTSRRARNLAAAAGCPLARLAANKETLGGCIGMWSGCALCAVTDMGLAAAVMEKLAEADPEKYRETADTMKIKADRMQARKKKKRG